MRFIQFASAICLCFLFLGFESFEEKKPSYDLRTVTRKVDCEKKKLYIDIEIKASNANSHFNLSSQNYRFTYNGKAVTKPKIAKEMVVSQVVNQDGAISFYGEHTLRGSFESMISYSISHKGGVGYYLNNTDWVAVGQIEFDIVDMDECINLNWHKFVGDDFPRTVITTKLSAKKMERVQEGEYTNAEACLKKSCKSSDRADVQPFESSKAICENR